MRDSYLRKNYNNHYEVTYNVALVIYKAISVKREREGIALSCKTGKQLNIPRMLYSEGKNYIVIGRPRVIDVRKCEV